MDPALLRSYCFHLASLPVRGGGLCCYAREFRDIQWIYSGGGGGRGPGGLPRSSKKKKNKINKNTLDHHTEMGAGAKASEVSPDLPSVCLSCQPQSQVGRKDEKISHRL